MYTSVHIQCHIYYIIVASQILSERGWKVSDCFSVPVGCGLLSQLKLFSCWWVDMSNGVVPVLFRVVAGIGRLLSFTSICSYFASTCDCPPSPSVGCEVVIGHLICRA